MFLWIKKLRLRGRKQLCYIARKQVCMAWKYFLQHWAASGEELSAGGGDSSVSRPLGSAVCKAQSLFCSQRANVHSVPGVFSVWSSPGSYLQVSSIKQWTFRPQHIVGVQNSEKKKEEEKMGEKMLNLIRNQGKWKLKSQ